MTTERAKPAQRLEAARQAIVADMDRLQQKIANLDDEVRSGQESINATVEVSNALRAELRGLLFALSKLPPPPTRARAPAVANGGDAAVQKPKRGRRAGAEKPDSDARQRTLAAAAEAGLLPKGDE